MKQRVTLVALIVMVGIIAVVQILRTNYERRRYNEFHTVTLTPAPAHTPQTDGQ